LEGNEWIKSPTIEICRKSVKIVRESLPEYANDTMKRNKRGCGGKRRRRRIDESSLIGYFCLLNQMCHHFCIQKKKSQHYINANFPLFFGLIRNMGRGGKAESSQEEGREGGSRGFDFSPSFPSDLLAIDH
jgi:hypothetical protein